MKTVYTFTFYSAIKIMVFVTWNNIPFNQRLKFIFVIVDSFAKQLRGCSYVPNKFWYNQEISKEYYRFYEESVLCLL